MSEKPMINETTNVAPTSPSSQDQIQLSSRGRDIMNFVNKQTTLKESPTTNMIHQVHELDQGLNALNEKMKQEKRRARKLNKTTHFQIENYQPTDVNFNPEFA